MKGFDSINEAVAKDLIGLVNQLNGLQKTSEVNYSVKNKNGDWVKKSFKYTPLDDILGKIKKDNNFALLQPIGLNENGTLCVKNILIHKSGFVLESMDYPIDTKEKIQDEGAEITYKKRYSLGAFLGISTEEDTDGNDPEATNVQKKEQPKAGEQKTVMDAKATDKQLAKVKELVTDIPAMLKYYKVEKIEDLTVKQASEIIAKKGSK